MKPYLQILIVVAAFFIQTSFVQGQYTYQTAKRYANNVLVSVPTDSNATLPAGIQTGCATVTTQPVWYSLGFCSDASMTLEFDHTGIGGSDMSVVIYGPFADTVNLGSKLINANIDTCHNATGGWSWVYNTGNYQRGDIYMILIMTATNAHTVKITAFSVTFIEFDSLYCPFCNSRLSELYQPICTVTYDSASQKNKLIWTKDIFTPAQDYVVYRENASSTYDTLAYQSISQLTEYIDMTSTPMVKQHVYRLGIRDSCGHFITKDKIGDYTSTPAFNTMHLIVYPGGNNTANLSWNKGWYYSGPFLIYRTNPSGITTLIDSVVATANPQTYTDINAPAGLCSYQIGVNLNPPCVASLLPSYTMVKSNPGYVTVTGINELDDLSNAISIEPNPFNDKLNITLNKNESVQLTLYDITSRKLLQQQFTTTTTLNTSHLAGGIYIYEVRNNLGVIKKGKVVKEATIKQ